MLLLLQSPSERQAQYLALAEATLREPIRTKELRAAVLSAGGVATIRALFERSIAEGLVVDGAVVTPELGGESTMEHGRLRLIVYPDPVHPLIRELVSRADEPETLLAFLEGSAEGRFLLKNTGGLHALLYQFAEGTASDGSRELLGSVIESTVATHFKTWTTDPLIQARMIERTEWRGRYVGFWHIHPPRMSRGSIAEGIEPSMADMRNAVELGQFLTIVFQPDGFDVYDLSPLRSNGRADLSRVVVVPYRDAGWRRHFEARFRRAHGSSTP